MVLTSNIELFLGSLQRKESIGFQAIVPKGAVETFYKIVGKLSLPKTHHTVQDTRFGGKR